LPGELIGQLQSGAGHAGEDDASVSEADLEPDSGDEGGSARTLEWCCDALGRSGRLKELMRER